MNYFLQNVKNGFVLILWLKKGGSFTRRGLIRGILRYLLVTASAHRVSRTCLLLQVRHRKSSCSAVAPPCGSCAASSRQWSGSPGATPCLRAAPPATRATPRLSESAPSVRTQGTNRLPATGTGSRSWGCARLVTPPVDNPSHRKWITIGESRDVSADPGSGERGGEISFPEACDQAQNLRVNFVL